MISKHNLAVIEASAKGYYVDDEGEVISPNGIVRKCKINKKGYKAFNIKVNGKGLIVYVHKLCAYKKYGYQALLCDCVRHLDGNPLNNKPNNIDIGSFSDNMLDVPKEKRVKNAKYASSCTENYHPDDIVEQIKQFKKSHSYNETMREFNISSKGTLWYMLNKRTISNNKKQSV